MKNVVRIAVVVNLLLATLAASASPAPPVTPSDPGAVYVVVLNGGKGPEPDFNKGGAKLLTRWSNRVVVELPPAALEAMQKHPRVKYVQHLLSGAMTATASPDRRVSANAVGTLSGGTLQWTTGDYQYDGSGNIEKVGPDGAGYTRRFVYDEVDRLVEAGLEAPAAAAGTYTNYSRYTYDSFGNRLTETTPAMAQTLTADRNTNHVAMQGATITYDGVGNMTQQGVLLYMYDPFSNLEEVDEPGTAQKMAIYDANDERIIFCGNGSTGPCAWTLRGTGTEVLRQYESGPIGNGNYPSYYLWVEDSVYRGNVLAGAQREANDGGRLHFHLDHLGSPRLTTNAAGQKVAENEFAPFGRELSSITQEEQLGYSRTETHRFTGHERDFVEGTGSDNVAYLDYMHARTYLPALGRFLSVDKHAGSAAQLQSWNRYAYVANNPMAYVDLDGNEKLRFTITAAIPTKFIVGPFGHTYNGGVKAQHVVTVETDPHKRANPIIEATSFVGHTVQYDFQMHPIREGQAPNDLIFRSPGGSAPGGRAADGSFTFGVEGNPAHPLEWPPALVPGITYDFSVTVTPDLQYHITGEHDQFPGYSVDVQREDGSQLQLYSFDPRNAGTSPWWLIPVFPNANVDEQGQLEQLPKEPPPCQDQAQRTCKQ